MKTIKLLIPLFIITLFVNCSKKNDLVEGSVAFTFVDENGEDVFKENNIYNLSITDYSVSPLTDGNEGYGHVVSNNMNIFITAINDIGDCVTYIKFGNINTDTIKTEWQNKGRITYISRLWYNGKELSIHNKRTYQSDPQTIEFKVD